MRKALTLYVCILGGCFNAHEVDDYCEMVTDPTDCCDIDGCIWYERHAGCFAESRACEDHGDCVEGTCQDMMAYGDGHPRSYCGGVIIPDVAQFGVCQ